MVFCALNVSKKTVARKNGSYPVAGEVCARSGKLNLLKPARKQVC